MTDSTTSGAAPNGTAPTGARPAPGSVEKLDRLKALLREMFQLDRGDLDFGLELWSKVVYGWVETCDVSLLKSSLETTVSARGAHCT